MSAPNEYTLVEKPILDTLTGAYGYRFIPPSEHASLRARENEVLFRPLLVEALVRINGIPEETASAVAEDLARIESNERWTEVLRGSTRVRCPARPRTGPSASSTSMMSRTTTSPSRTSCASRVRSSASPTWSSTSTASPRGDRGQEPDEQGPGHLRHHRPGAVGRARGAPAVPEQPVQHRHQRRHAALRRDRLAQGVLEPVARPVAARRQ